MKRVIFLFGLVFAGLVSFNSCKKNRTSETVNPKEEQFSIDEAKAWFTKNVSKKQGTSARKLSNFTVLWNTAKASEDKKYSIIECDLNFEKVPGFFVGDSGTKVTKKESQINGDTRLVFLKSKNNDEIHGYLMNSYSRKEMNKGRNSYTHVGKDFDGFVFFTDLVGNFVNGWEYQDGKIVRSTRGAETKASKPDTKAAFVAPVEDCGWIEVQTYERLCFYDEGVVLGCTQWQYVGSDFYYYCPNTGGGGGGIEETCNAPIGSVLAVKDKIEICGTGDNTRTKCYYWKIYTVSGGTFLPLYLKSKEQAKQVLGPNDYYWRFENFTHQDIYPDGAQILYSVSTSNVTATPSISSLNGVSAQMAKMHLSFTVNISAICRGMPIVYSDPRTTSNSWHVNE